MRADGRSEPEAGILPQLPRGLNFFEIDADLQLALEDALTGELARWRPALSDFGAWAGGPLDEQAAYTDRYGRPKLVPYGRDGRLINHIRYNPAWEAASREIYRRGIVGLNYAEPRAPFSITFAMGYLTSQSDVSLHCPATMTAAVAHVLNRFAPEGVRQAWLPKLVSMTGDALSAGTWATELHGGSDIGATTTVARPEGEHFRLTGLKWFTSNVDGGIALATARPEGAGPGSSGLGLYLVPTVMPDGSPNPMRIRRLKDKLGTCGVATAEVDLTDTWAAEVAPPPDGFRLMMEALVFSRIHNAMSGAGVQRRAYLEALAFAAGRRAFGERIIAYPMVQHELATICAAWQADLALALEAAHAFDRAWDKPPGEASPERTWLRLATALAKYQTAETANRTARAAMELIGGNAYTYDYVAPRLLRDAQVLTIWEGPANVQALELLRLLGEPYGGFALFRERIAECAGKAEAALPELAGRLREALAECNDAVRYLSGDRGRAATHARRLLALMADLLGAALLSRQAAALKAQGDERKAIAARLYVEQRFAAPARRGIGPETEWLHARFEEMVAGDLTALAAR